MAAGFVILAPPSVITKCVITITEAFFSEWVITPIMQLLSDNDVAIGLVATGDMNENEKYAVEK